MADITQDASAPPIGDLIREAITEYIGPKCPDFYEDCLACEAWKKIEDFERLQVEHPKLLKLLSDTSAELGHLRAVARHTVEEFRLENERLRKENAELVGDGHSTYAEQIQRMREACDHLKRENERLRAEVKFNSESYQQLFKSQIEDGDAIRIKAKRVLCRELVDGASPLDLPLCGSLPSLADVVEALVAEVERLTREVANG